MTRAGDAISNGVNIEDRLSARSYVFLGNPALEEIQNRLNLWLFQNPCIP
jgi:hypothetical protein